MPPIDPARCPLCGQPNQCAATGQSAGPCWCVTATIPRAQLERIPPELRGRACICPRCARQTPADAPAPPDAPI